MKKTFHISLKIIIIGFAIFGFVLSSAFIAVKLKLTNDPGNIDVNDRQFKVLSQKVYKEVSSNNVYLKNKQDASIFHRIRLINEFYPTNANLLIHAFQTCRDKEIILRMLDAIEIRLSEIPEYNKIKSDYKYLESRTPNPADTNFYAWMNNEQWSDLKISIAKEKKTIDSVAKVTGVEARMIVMCVMGEQIRIYNTRREKYKSYLGPLKVLSTGTTISFGVTGIKAPTAQKAENYIKDTNSVFYLGKKYENLLDFKTDNPEQERISRLTDINNHYYSYLYAAIIVKQTQKQWVRAGYNLEHRPEILATLFNLGYQVSKPSDNPKCGGSGIEVKGIEYTFGSLGYDFYYSGELFDEFPIQEKHFDE